MRSTSIRVSYVTRQHIYTQPVRVRGAARLDLARNHTFNTASFASDASPAWATVSDEEVNKFARIKSEWWNANSRFGTGPLHSINPARMKFITQCLKTSNLINISICDVGCGGGIAAEALARLGAQVLAIDPSPDNIEVANEHKNLDPLTKSINYKCATIEQLAEEQKQFDIVTALDVIEHVNNPAGFLSSCAACLRPGGSLFISTINKSIKSYGFAIVAAERVLGIVPSGTHDWNKFVTPDELRKELENVGLQLTMTTGIVLNQLYLISNKPQWVLDKYDCDVNYIAHAVKI